MFGIDDPVLGILLFAFFFICAVKLLDDIFG